MRTACSRSSGTYTAPETHNLTVLDLRNVQVVGSAALAGTLDCGDAEDVLPEVQAVIEQKVFFMN